MTRNLLKLNEDKTEFLILGSSHTLRNLPPIQLNFCGSLISSSLSVRNLGITFDSQLNMSNHINILRRNINFQLRNISRIRRFLDFESCHHIVRALVLSRLDYGNSLLIGAKECDLDKLQRLQNWAAKLIFRAKKDDSASNLLRTLHWLPVRQRIDFKICLYIFKCVKGLGPSYLNELTKFYKPGHLGLRSASDSTLLQIHRTYNTTGDKPFEVAGAKLWNDLPAELRLCDSINVFKKCLNTSFS
jgi:hypothetical protein